MLHRLVILIFPICINHTTFSFIPIPNFYPFAYSLRLLLSGCVNWSRSGHFISRAKIGPMFRRLSQKSVANPFSIHSLIPHSQKCLLPNPQRLKTPSLALHHNLAPWKIFRFLSPVNQKSSLLQFYLPQLLPPYCSQALRLNP